MRKPFMAGNWKMNKDAAASRELAAGLRTAVKGISDVDIAVFPPFLSIPAVVEALAGSNVAVGAQNFYWEDEGAFTGEVSAPMLKAAGCTCVLAGHSERRQFFGETDETVNKRLKAALKHGILPIMCCGETLTQREKGMTKKVVETQIKKGLADLSASQMKSVTIAYEPIWAIGTGKTATPEQAEEVHAFIRGMLAGMFGKATADGVRIQYGGSVKPENVAELIACENIDGALVGGASLKADSFARIANLGRD